MEGIFVFPSTGDVVVRLHGPCRKKECTFHRDRLQKAVVEHKCVVGSCRGPMEVLKFEGLATTGEVEKCQVGADELVDRPAEVLSFITRSLKLKPSTPSVMPHHEV